MTEVPAEGEERWFCFWCTYGNHPCLELCEMCGAGRRASSVSENLSPLARTNIPNPVSQSPTAENEEINDIHGGMLDFQSLGSCKVAVGVDENNVCTNNLGTSGYNKSGDTETNDVCDLPNTNFKKVVSESDLDWVFINSKDIETYPVRNHVEPKKPSLFCWKNTPKIADNDIQMHVMRKSSVNGIDDSKPIKNFDDPSYIDRKYHENLKVFRYISGLPTDDTKSFKSYPDEFLSNDSNNNKAGELDRCYCHKGSLLSVNRTHRRTGSDFGGLDSNIGQSHHICDQTSRPSQLPKKIMYGRQLSQSLSDVQTIDPLVQPDASKLHAFKLDTYPNSMDKNSNDQSIVSTNSTTESTGGSRNFGFDSQELPGYGRFPYAYAAQNSDRQK